jgi:hypothetical protein
MAMITIDDTSVGTVIPGPAALTRIEVTTMPVGRYGAVPGSFTLVDNGGPERRQVFNVDSLGLGIMLGEVICRQNTGIGIGPVLSTYPIEFGSLLVTAVPLGGVFELETQ